MASLFIHACLGLQTSKTSQTDVFYARILNWDHIVFTLGHAVQKQQSTFVHSFV